MFNVKYIIFNVSQVAVFWIKIIACDLFPYSRLILGDDDAGADDYLFCLKKLLIEILQE
jgi:hypothetical protein